MTYQRQNINNFRSDTGRQAAAYKFLIILNGPPFKQYLYSHGSKANKQDQGLNDLVRQLQNQPSWARAMLYYGPGKLQKDLIATYYPDGSIKREP